MTGRKDFPHKRYNEGITMRQVEDAVNSRPIPQGRQSINERIIILWMFSPRSMSLDPHKAPNLSGPAMERWTPRTPSCESQQGLPIRQQKGVANRESMLKRLTEKSHILRVPTQRQQFERSLDQTHLLILESLKERQEATRTTPGTINTGQTFGELVLP